MPKIHILLDMDEVICDWERGALAIHGWTQEAYERIRLAGRWDMTKPLGLTLDEFWQPIHDAGEQFWIDLKPLPWAHKVVDLVKSVTDDWFVISTPSREPSSYAGKIIWLRHFFGSRFDKFELTTRKHLFAQSGVVLIDDKEQNINEFRAAGGQGILFPTRGNAHYAISKDPVNYLALSLGRS